MHRLYRFKIASSNITILERNNQQEECQHITLNIAQDNLIYIDDINKAFKPQIFRLDFLRKTCDGLLINNNQQYIVVFELKTTINEDNLKKALTQLISSLLKVFLLSSIMEENIIRYNIIFICATCNIKSLNYMKKKEKIKEWHSSKKSFIRSLFFEIIKKPVASCESNTIGEIFFNRAFTLQNIFEDISSEDTLFQDIFNEGVLRKEYMNIQVDFYLVKCNSLYSLEEFLS